MSEQTTVSFNKAEQKLHKVLLKNKITVRPFSKFVKDAFYSAIERAKINEALGEIKK